MKKKNKKQIRKKYLIDKRFQLFFTGRLIVLQVFLVLFTAVSVSFFYLFIVDSRLAADHNTALFQYLGVLFIITNLLVIAWAIKFTHSIAGPLFKLSEILSDAAGGNFPSAPVRFRDNDRFKALSAPLNRCLETMKTDRKHIRSTHESIQALRKIVNRNTVSASAIDQTLKDIAETGSIKDTGSIKEVYQSDQRAVS